jgi:beta-lactamase regulating signal transducer with metallopeptidase domain
MSNCAITDSQQIDGRMTMKKVTEVASTELGSSTAVSLDLADATSTNTEVVAMSGMEKIKVASTAAEAIVASFTGIVTEDAAEVRKAELATKSPEELVEIIMSLEKPKTTGGLTVETVARKFMEDPALAMFTWPQIALLVKRVLPDANTSSKSIASYASKRKGDWKIAPRVKFSFDPMEMLKAGNE